MKKYIFIIALFYPLLLFAQESSITGGDGQDWIALSDSYKAGYIQGYISSVVQTSEDARQTMEWITFDIRIKYYKVLPIDSISNKMTDINKKIWEFKDKMENRRFLHIQYGTVDAVRYAFDNFYSDPVNHKIRISEAFRYVTARMNGAPKNALETLMEILHWEQENPHPILSYDNVHEYFDKSREWKSRREKAFPDCLKLISKY